jgi:hypothetical protein
MDVSGKKWHLSITCNFFLGGGGPQLEKEVIYQILILELKLFKIYIYIYSFNVDSLVLFASMV